MCVLGRGTSLLLRGTSKVTKCSEPPATHPSQDPGIREGQEVPTACEGTGCWLLRGSHLRTGPLLSPARPLHQLGPCHQGRVGSHSGKAFL